VAFQFMDLLTSMGVEITAVLPNGRKPKWFFTEADVMSETQVWSKLREEDWLMITWPPDYERLKNRGRLVCHCQGTDVRMDPIFADQDVPILTCWRQAEAYVREVHGRATIPVGIAISDGFFYDGRLKWDNRVAYMPRRGWNLVKRCMKTKPHLDYQPIDGLRESGVSCRLMSSGVYLATSVGEEFGLPALEAMAAGCAVISAPVKGGLEYLLHEDNCLLGQPEALPDLLDWLMWPAQEDLRKRFRVRGIETAKAYRLSEQRRKLALLLKEGLSWLR